MFEKSVNVPHSVFVSYSREDRNFVELLIHKFRDYGINTYRDMEAIQPGESFQESISKAIDQSSVVICLVSRDYLKSAWCKAEIETAFAHGRPIIPVFLEDTPVEGPLSFLNSLDLRGIDDLTSEKLDQPLATLRRAINTLADRNKDESASSNYVEGDAS